MLNLLRLTAGEDWSDLMYDTMNHSKSCIPGKSCGSSWNFLFFVVFLLVIRLILFNIFVLIVVQQFEENYICSDNPLQHYNADIKTFKEKWVSNTFKQNGLRLNQTDIIKLFLNLPPPLGFGILFLVSSFILNRFFFKKSIFIRIPKRNQRKDPCKFKKKSSHFDNEYEFIQ